MSEPTAAVTEPRTRFSSECDRALLAEAVQEAIERLVAFDPVAHVTSDHAPAHGMIDDLDEDDEDDGWWDEPTEPDDLDDDLGDCWIAHDEPGRPFSFGMWLCHCAACEHALRGEVASRPDTAMVLRTQRERLVVTARQLLDALERSSAEALCRPGDEVREIFVASAALQPRRAGR